MKLLSKLAASACIFSMVLSSNVFAADKYDEDAVPSTLYTAALCGNASITNVDDDVYVTVSSPEKLAMKEGMTDNSKTLVNLPDGYALTVLGAEYGWVNVQDDEGHTGYVRGAFLTFHNGEKPENASLPSMLAQQICDYSKQFIGTPYVWGGTNLTSGVDCSGLVMMCYKNFGISLPRTSREMYTKGTPVAKEDLQPGDLVFFNTFGSGVSHVGMYVGDNTYIEAGDDGVCLSDINRPYALRTYIGAKRIIE
ncbi:MAG: C40 family peptidase [Firmicutes bacterium]|nr:C40 family peptidase [Bacillota bacterium]